MTTRDRVDVVAAHHERVTVRAGDVFLKIDIDQERSNTEVAALNAAPIPTPNILWRAPPVLALAALPGRPLARLGEPSTASQQAWASAGSVVRVLHDAPLPTWSCRDHHDISSELDVTCEWIIANEVLPADLVRRNRRIAEAALRPWAPAFTHGDLQAEHVFVDGDDVTGVIDWSEASAGDAMYDLATMTIGHQDHLEAVVTGYGLDVDREVIRAWWSLRSLRGVRWLVEHGLDPFRSGCEVDVLKAQL
ncbi:aminoglycoside phosphotransferase family protein [Pseudonocardia sp. NPDC049635]|uniref:aminoglycoside phosphotransferase family protein n=1 Tax=Pseudonocardia sp. NPDC049635 TaxID=3155506 RepID=UPI0033F21540